MIKWAYKSINGDYVFEKVSNEVQKYKSLYNKTVIDLGVGDVKMPPPNNVCKQLKKQVERFVTPTGFCGYQNECGILPLRERICEYYESKGATIYPDEVFITNGAKPSLGELLEIANFTKALIITPTYPLYEELCKVHKIKTTFCKLNDFYKFKHNKFDVIFLCSPNNPSGEIVDNALMQAFIDFANEKNSTVILDGAYADFSKNYQLPYVFENSERVIEVRTYSKNLSFTGLRCGYTVIKRKNPFNGAYKRYLSLRSNGVNVIMQKCAICCYDKITIKEVDMRVALYKERAKKFKSLLKSKKVTLFGGEDIPYILIKSDKNGYSFFKELLYNCSVAVTPGEPFHADNCVRVSCFSSESDILSGAKIINEYLGE